jgi:hypothetical protein
LNGFCIQPSAFFEVVPCAVSRQAVRLIMQQVNLGIIGGGTVGGGVFDALQRNGILVKFQNCLKNKLAKLRFLTILYENSPLQSLLILQL